MDFVNNWIRQRWWEGRTGTTLYLMLFLAILNFILISYRFLIEQNSLLDDLISNLSIFVLFFVVTYIPISIIIGHWHKETQWEVELALKQLENPLNAKMFRTMIDVQTGKASEKETEEFREFLKKIENQKD